MDDLRAAVARALRLTPATRLVSVAAADLVDATPLAVYAGFVVAGAAGERGAVADPLRLPLVEGLADLVLARWDGTGEPAAQLREAWRVLAPAGAVVVVAPLPPGLRRLIARRRARARLARALAAAMFDAGTWSDTRGALIVRADKRDGLALQRPQAAAVYRRVAAPEAG